jgi:hypothetical protein
MTKEQSSVVVATSCLGLLLAASCGSDPDVAMPYCASGNGLLCEPAAMPFVVSAGTRSDACPGVVGTPCTMPMSQSTTALSQPEPGKICMKGVVAGPAGWAWLLLGVSKWDRTRTHIVGVLDAKALGIAGLTFNVEKPPTVGMSLFATTAAVRQCAMPVGCLGEGWNLMTGPRSGLVKAIATPGPVNAPFADFARQDPNQVLDTSALAHFIFVLSPGAYDFCISDLKFVDSAGAEVVPPATVDAGAAQD